MKLIQQYLCTAKFWQSRSQLFWFVLIYLVSLALWGMTEFGLHMFVAWLGG